MIFVGCGMKTLEDVADLIVFKDAIKSHNEDIEHLRMQLENEESLKVRDYLSHAIEVQKKVVLSYKRRIEKIENVRKE